MKKFKFNKLQKSDSKRLLPILNDSEIKENLPGLYCQTLEDVEEMFYSFGFSNGQLFEILDSKNNTVGILGAESIDSNRLELSFLICKEFRNKHYSSQSLKEFILKLKEERKTISDIFFFINKNNKKSKKVIESIGAKFSHNYEDEEAVYVKKIYSDSEEFSK